MANCNAKTKLSLGNLARLRPARMKVGSQSFCLRRAETHTKPKPRAETHSNTQETHSSAQNHPLRPAARSDSGTHWGASKGTFLRRTVGKDDQILPPSGGEASGCPPNSPPGLPRVNRALLARDHQKTKL